MNNATEATTWTVAVDRAACIGTGVCVSTSPEHLEIRDGKVSARATETGPAQYLLDAADMCPMAAITVTETATGRVLAPEE
ncbi:MULTISPECIES: ferredoxin [Actinosynnema]|uniref:ferredoxin n=1 Tax=Actinosynnema TaxID=40566 RepID=UPI0020A2CA0D|nr:ferredoxin [Actinosynnema pretiosum]MCP2092271.1 ferredoxin [Actinosynnema pretiosum]